MIIRARAPLRISFGGGGTDVEPFPTKKGGCVLNSTIDKYVYTTVSPRSDGKLVVNSLDMGVNEEVKDFVYGSKIDLVKAVLKNLGVSSGAEVSINSEAPPGSGLGGSSTVVISLIGALQKWLGLPRDNYQLAKLAYKIEREELGIKGGYQDQVAAAFGGFNFVEFNPGGKFVVTPLRIDEDIIDEMQASLFLCNIGKTRNSSDVIERQVKSLESGQNEEFLDEMKKICYQMKDALLTGNLEEFVFLMDQTWQEKKKLAEGIANPEIDALYNIARISGAKAGKVTGAGGGGHMLFYCEHFKKPEVARALLKRAYELNMTLQIVPFSFDNFGMKTWRVRA